MILSNYRISDTVYSERLSKGSHNLTKKRLHKAVAFYSIIRESDNSINYAVYEIVILNNANQCRDTEGNPK